LLHLDVSKLDRVLQLPPRLSAVSPQCQARKTSASGGGPYWRRRAPRACGRAQQARHGAGRRESGTGGSGADIQSDRGASAQTLATS
jgi:hypothetical protein